MTARSAPVTRYKGRCSAAPPHHPALSWHGLLEAPLSLLILPRRTPPLLRVWLLARVHCCLQLREKQPNNKMKPRPGSVLIHTTLPDAVAEMLKTCVVSVDPSCPHSALVTMLEELGVLAIGRVFARKERILYLPAAPDERKGVIRGKLREMMDDFAEENEQGTQAGSTDLVVYFDAEFADEPTVEMGEALNANFAMIVLQEACTQGVELGGALDQVINDHARRQALLERTEATLSDAYCLVALNASRTGSLAASILEPTTPPSTARWPGFYAASQVRTPSMTTSIQHQVEAALAPIALPVPEASVTTSSSSEPPWLREASRVRDQLEMDADCVMPVRTPRAENMESHATASPAALPKANTPAHSTHNASSMDEHEKGHVTPSKVQHTKPSRRSVDRELEQAKRGAPPRMQTIMTEGSRLTGDVYEELTRPHAPSARLLTEFDGPRPAAQRSRLPAPSSAFALNEHLKIVGAEIDGEQPFELFGEHIEEEDEEPIVDKVLRKYHEEHYRYEKWSNACKRYCEYVQNQRLLLDDQQIASVNACMSNGQKLEFTGSTDGCLYGVVALHVHGSAEEKCRKLVADKLVDWMLESGEEATFYGMTLRDWVCWDRVPPNVQTWSELMVHLRESFAYLEYTAADWLLYVSTAHVFGPVVVFSARLSRAVRFVAADGRHSEVRSYIDAAQLPAASEMWLRVGMLENGHFVRCRSKELKSELMLRMCDTRDIELQGQLSVDVPDAVIFQGPSKAGKSTIMNGLARKTLYDSTPPTPRKGEPKGDKIEPELSVLGAPVQGSEIGRDKESETLLVNSMVISTDDDDTPKLQLLDTPGMFDTRGPLIEVVNAVSIAKCMVRFKTLRIVVMVREAALDGTGEGFANTAVAMSKLFSMAGGSASAKRHVLLWINPHKPEVSYGDKGIINEIKKMNAARPEIGDFLRAIVSQHNTRKVVHMLEYEPETAQGDEREKIVRARQQRYPNADPDAPVTKAVFDIDGLLDQLIALQPMRNPAEKCGLPLTEPAVAEIARQAEELHGYVSLRCDLCDYRSLLRYLDVLQALCKHMQAGSVAMQGQNKFDTQYQASLTSVTEQLKATCSKVRMEELCLPIKQPVAIEASNLDAICFSMRAASAATVLEPHLGRFLGSWWRELNIDACCSVVCSHVQSVSAASCQLLSDHFINGSSGLQAAYRVFGDQVKLILTKLQHIKERFGVEAEIVDGASKSFASIAHEADQSLKHLYKTLLLAVDTQAKAAADHVTRGLDGAALAASQYLKSQTNEDDPSSSALESTPAATSRVDPFDAATNALDVVKTAEESLAYLTDAIHGVYAASRGQAISVVEKQSQEVCTLIKQEKGDASKRPLLTALWRHCTGEDFAQEKILASLLFLLRARSSSLRKHCADETAVPATANAHAAAEALGRLDACYEEPVSKIVEWHAGLVDGVLEAAKRGNDSFVKSLSDFQMPVELSAEVAKLASVESIQSRCCAMQPCAKWSILHVSAKDLLRRIEVALSTFGIGVDSRLKEHSTMIANATLDVVEQYDYNEHAKDLSVLKNAQWCDSILAEPIIETTIITVWQVFEKHIKRLAQGEDGAVALLRKGKHKHARTLLVQIHGMEVLFDEALVIDLDIAQRVKEIHDQVEKVANEVIADKCEKAHSKVLERPGATGKRERWDWWIDIGVRNANFTDALWHLNSLLDLAHWLITASKGDNRLDSWLNLVELERVKLDCSNRANDVLVRLRSRVQGFFAAVGSCHSEDMEAAVIALTGDEISAETLMANMEEASVASDDMTPSEDSLDMKAAIQVACREVKDVLQLLSRPSAYSALFAAAQDKANPDSMLTDDFHDLERLFQTTYMECQINFGDDQTVPVARQMALYIYSEFDRSLPSDKAFENFKKTYQSHYQLLYSSHQQAKKGEKIFLQANFAKNEFNQETYRMMIDMRNSAEADPRSRGAYEAACSDLHKHVKGLLEYVSMSFSHLKHPEQSFRAQDHLVKPWNQLQDARSHTQFLNEASGSTKIDLDAELAQMVQRFEIVFTEEVLRPFAKMFDMGDYIAAEGDSTFGLKRVHILTDQIQAQGGQLGKVAKMALDAERDRQKTALEQAHQLPFDVALNLPQEDDDTLLNERMRDVDLFLEKSFTRISQLGQSQCKVDCVLATEYKAAHDRILKEVRAFLLEEFGPLFRDDYVNMHKMHVNYLHKLLAQMHNGGYVSDAARLLNVQGAHDAIEKFHELTDHQDQECFSSMSPDQQADVIRSTSTRSKSYIPIVQEFLVAHKNAVQRADVLLRTNPADVPPCELEAVISGVRTRATCAHELKGIKLDMRVIADLEALLRGSRAQMENWLTANQLSPLLAPTSFDASAAATRDTMLLRVIQTYTSLVKLTPTDYKSSSTTDHAASPSSMPADNPVIEEPDNETSEKGGFSAIINGAKRLLSGGTRRKSDSEALASESGPSEPLAIEHADNEVLSSSHVCVGSEGDAAMHSPASGKNQTSSYHATGSSTFASGNAFSSGHTSEAAQVMILLCNKLNETIAQWQDVPETPAHINLKHHALLRLQRWEPVENAGNSLSGANSIFDAAFELETALIKEGSLAAGQQLFSRPVPHDMRMSKTREQMDVLLRTALAEIEFVDQFDPTKHESIDPKPFVMIFSSELQGFIQHLGYSLAAIEALKDEVTKRAADLKAALDVLLNKRKNKEVDCLLQMWKYLEPLTGLAAFKHVPDASVFDTLLKDHASKLSKQAKAAVQMSDKKDGWAKAVSMPLLFLAKFGSDVPRAANFSNEAMAEVLSAAEAKFGAQGMQQLAAELREREPALGNEIICSSDAFVAVTVADFNQKTQRDISVVKKLYADKNGGEPENDIWRKYEQFEREYNRLLQHCTDGLEQVDDPLAFLVNQAKDQASRDKGVLYDSQEHIPKVLAAIFAWWSIDFLVKLRKRNPHLRADPAKLRRANNGQVVCILRLLGCSGYWTSIGSKFRNHLAEVPTGEGKSVVIGVLATTLALYGFDVDCVCYSSMLSSRDHDDFNQMFMSFRLMDRIRYGTFDTLCEKLLIEHHGDLRQAARDFITTGTSTRQTITAPAQRALVIDEVDVFCSEAFFGGAFCPTLTLQHDAIAELMIHLWESRTSSLDLTTFKQHPRYKAVLDSGMLAAGNEWLLERAVREMHKAAHGYSAGMHEHILRGGKILYKIEGRDEYGLWTYDYETNAEYLAEFDRGNLDQQQLKQGLSMYVRCGEFSYGALPSMFQHILGVTGTLDSEKLPPQMHEVLQREIGIEQFTYCPSMYHAQKRDFKPDSDKYVQLAKDVDEHYHLIIDQIDDRLTPTTDMEGQRSVIVFFPTAEELHKFRDSSYFGKFREKANVLTELTACRREDRDNIIKSATRQGMVTLASRMYGRGTDFKIFDDRMEKAGGMHVLQTFFSRDLSEEVQIMGRCARQGNKGSYSQVLLSGTVAKDFDLTVETVQSWEPTTVYAQLSRLRASAGAAEVKSLREMAEHRRKEHNVLAAALHEFHYHQKTSQLGQLMRRYNSPGGMAIGPNGMHVVFCLDESGSMSWGTPWGGTPWSELMSAFKVFWEQSAAEPGPPMYVSVVQFGNGARVTKRMVRLQGQAPRLSPQWSTTCFKPAVDAAEELVRNNGGPPSGYTAVVVFMSDGAAGDSSEAAQVLESMAQQYGDQFASYTVGFGSGAPKTLEQMAFANGVQEKNNYRAASVGGLAEAFSAVAKSIAPGRL